MTHDLLTHDLDRPLAWSEDSESVVGVAATRLAENGIVRIANFPSDARRYVRFLTAFGTPLMYYADSPGVHPDDPVIWRIRYEHDGAARGDAHAVDGPLSPHSSQSLREPRPPYFSMLMINRGWDHLNPGHNGESILVRWAEAFRLLHREYPVNYRSLVQALQTPMSFPDGVVDLPVIYTLGSPADPFDLGVRFKSGLAEHLDATGAHPKVVAAVRHLAEAARRVAHIVALNSGDLILMDNDRWGHGRQSVLGYETRGGETVLNPRELWSVTLG